MENTIMSWTLIREESMNAQQAFQERSNLVRDIIELLANLNVSQDREAIDNLNKEFFALNQQNDLEALQKFLLKLRNYGLLNK